MCEITMHPKSIAKVAQCKRFYGDGHCFHAFLLEVNYVFATSAFLSHILSIAFLIKV